MPRWTRRSNLAFRTHRVWQAAGPIFPEIYGPFETSNRSLQELRNWLTEKAFDAQRPGAGIAAGSRYLSLSQISFALSAGKPRAC